MIELERLGEFGGEAIERDGGGLGFTRRRRDDQGRTGLVDQHVVGLVDEHEPERTLQQFGPAARRPAGQGRSQVAASLVELPLDQSVFEEIEAKLLGRPVGDVAGVRGATRVKIHLRFDDPHFEAQGLINRRHPLGVTAGEVVVDGGEVRTLAGQGIEHQRQRGHEGLALAGLHLCDRTLHQSGARQQLHVVVPHADPAPACFTGGGERFNEERVEWLTSLRAIRERPPEPLEGDVVERLHFRSQRVDFADLPPRDRRDGRRPSGSDSTEPAKHGAAPR